MTHTNHSQSNRRDFPRKKSNKFISLKIKKMRLRPLKRLEKNEEKSSPPRREKATIQKPGPLTKEPKQEPPDLDEIESLAIMPSNIQSSERNLKRRPLVRPRAQRKQLSGRLQRRIVAQRKQTKAMERAQEPERMTEEIRQGKERMTEESRQVKESFPKLILKRVNLQEQQHQAEFIPRRSKRLMKKQLAKMA